jgi:MFS family permease
LSISGFIGATLAIFFGGKLMDLISTRMTGRAAGRREPEYRLPAIIIPAVIGPMGILLFGLTVADKRPWIQPAVGHAMQGFGRTAVSNVVVTYAVDSYLPLAGEALVTVFVVRGAIGCCLALFAFNWITATGRGCLWGDGCYSVLHASLRYCLPHFWKKNQGCDGEVWADGEDQ